MFFRNPSDMQTTNSREELFKLKDLNAQIKLLKELDDYEFNRLISFPENKEQYTALFKILAQDETLIQRKAKADESFVKFSESWYAGGFVWGTCPRPPQGPTPYSGGALWTKDAEQKPEALNGSR